MTRSELKYWLAWRDYIEAQMVLEADRQAMAALRHQLTHDVDGRERWRL